MEPHAAPRPGPASVDDRRPGSTALLLAGGTGALSGSTSALLIAHRLGDGGELGGAVGVTIALSIVLIGLLAIGARRRMRRDVALRNADLLRADALERSEQQLRLAEQVASLGSFDWNPRSGELRWSEMHFRLWGLDPLAVAPSYEVFRQGVHPDDLAALEDLLNRSLQGGRLYDCRHRVRWPDGSVHPIHARGEVFFDAAGQAVRMIGTVQDVIEQEASRIALAASLEHLKRTLNATGDAMFAYDVADTDGRLLFANEQFFAMWRIPPEDAAATGRAEIITAARRLFVDPDAEVARIASIIALKVLHEDRVQLRDNRVL